MTSQHTREVGLHLDIGRKPLQPSLIVETLEHAASVGVNALQLHVSENLGYRLPSSRRPEIVSPEHLSLAGLADIRQAAADLDVRLVPSLDMPGHFEHIVARYPDLRLPDGDGGFVPSAIDLERPGARALVEDLLADLGEIFPESTAWNLGFDEIVPEGDRAKAAYLDDRARRRFGANATSHDLIAAYANEFADALASQGRELRLWNDAMFRGEVVRLDPRVTLCWWTNWHRDMAPLRAAVDTGHRVVNFNDSLLYFVLGEMAGYRYPTPERIATAEWAVGEFSALPDGSRQALPADHPQLAGAYLSVWGDVPDAMTPRELQTRLRAPLAEFALRARVGLRARHEGARR